MRDIPISLKMFEVMQGAHVGMMRQVQNLKNGAMPGYGEDANMDWQLNIEGALAEMALAKHLNVYWTKGEMRDPDVGDVECRSSTNHDRRLILHPKDRDDARFYFVTGCNGEYLIRGWIRGYEGKRDEWWEDPTGKGRPAYFIDPSCLSHET